MTVTRMRKKITNGMAAAGLASMLLASGCSTTVASAPAAAQAVQSGGPLPSSVTGFLGPDAAKLAPGPEGGAALAWINPAAQWSSYTKIQLMPVEFWAAADSKVSTADQAVLTEYFYNALQANLSKSFALVDQPGPGVMTLRVALMDATTAVPGLRTISVIVPQARVLNMAQSLATDSYAFVVRPEVRNQADRLVTGVAGRSGRSALRRYGDRAQLHSNGATRRTRWNTGRRKSNRISQLQGKTPRRARDNPVVSKRTKIQG